MSSWPCHLAVVLTAFLSANVVSVRFLWLLPRVSQTSHTSSGERVQRAAVVGRGEGMGEKLFCCVLLLPGLLGPELTWLGLPQLPAALLGWPGSLCLAAGTRQTCFPCQCCSQHGFVWKRILCCQVSGLHFHTIPAWLGLALLDWLCGAQGCAGKAPNKPLAGSCPRACWQSCAFMWS